MGKMYYDLSPDDYRSDKIESEFEFVDVDGNEVSGRYCHRSIMDLLEYLGDVITDKTSFHSTHTPSDFSNGIIDTSKPLTITIHAKHSD